MTTVVKQHKTEKYYISIEMTERNGNAIYKVQACPRFDEYRCGYPIIEATYPINEKEKAYATYRRYKKKYTQC